MLNQAMKVFNPLSVILVLTLAIPCFAANNSDKEQSNYCHDKASWQQWHDLLEKHPQDDAIHALYATRRGLCSMVESHQITLERATHIFEKMRASLVTRYQRQNEASQEGKNESM